MRASRRSRPAQGLSGRSLEQRIYGLARSHGRLVALPGQEVRRMRAADVRADMVARSARRATAAADRARARKVSREARAG